MIDETRCRSAKRSLSIPKCGPRHKWRARPGKSCPAAPDLRLGRGRRRRQGHLPPPTRRRTRDRFNVGSSARGTGPFGRRSVTGKRPKGTFRHAPNTSDHQRCGQSVECVTDRGLCWCSPQRVWLLRGTVRRLEPNNVVGEEPQGGDEPCVVVCVVSRSPRSR